MRLHADQEPRRAKRCADQSCATAPRNHRRISTGFSQNCRHMKFWVKVLPEDFASSLPSVEELEEELDADTPD